jgi:hypothetical protein
MNKIIMEQRLIMEELGRMKTLMSVKRGTIISEQPTLTKAQQIGTDIKNATDRRFGTGEKEFVDAIMKINNPNEFNSVEAFLKSGGSKMGIQDLINTEFGWKDAQYVIDIEKWLNEIGVKSVSGIPSTQTRGQYKGGFKITTPTTNTTKPQPTRKENIAKVYCSVINGKIPSLTTSKGVVTNMLWSKYESTYRVTPEELKSAQLSCPEKVKTIDSGILNVKTINKKRPLQFTTNENFPLRFMQKGLAIRNLQSLIGLKKPTGNFYTVTEKMLSDKMKSLGLTYNRKVGVTQDIYNKLNQSAQQNSSKAIISPEYQYQTSDFTDEAGNVITPFSN